MYVYVTYLQQKYFPFRQHSMALVKKKHPNWPKSTILQQAIIEFDKSARLVGIRREFEAVVDIFMC